MPRTKQTAQCEAPNTTTSATSYNSMSNAELKKIIDERKIEGRSKLTLKTAMIEALTFQDENPEDKKGLAELISKYNKPKKDTSDSERGSRTESSSAKSETSTKKSSGSESSSGGKKSESKSSEPKVKKSKKTDWLEEHGINRNEYPPGTRFTKSKIGGKIKVHFPKDHELSEDEKESLEVKILSVNEQIKEPKVEPKLIVRRVPSKQSQEPDELDDIPLVKKSKVSKPVPKIVDHDETEEEDPRAIEMKRKEIEAMKKKQLLNRQVESITTTLFGIDISNDPMEEDQDTNSKSSQKRQREEPKPDKEREPKPDKEREVVRETKYEEETEEESMTHREDEESQDPESEFTRKGYISMKRQQSKEISELCGKMMVHIKYFDLNCEEFEDKEKLIKVLNKMIRVFNKIK